MNILICNELNTCKISVFKPGLEKTIGFQRQE